LDADTGKAATLSLDAFTTRVTVASFTPDGRRVAGGIDARVAICDVSTGKEVLSLRGHTGTVNGASFNHDGGRLLSASDKELILWDVSSATALRSWTSQRVGVFSPDGRHGASIFPEVRYKDGRREHSLVVWDGQTGSSLRSIPAQPEERFDALAFSPDGGKLVVAVAQRNEYRADRIRDAALKVWDVDSGNLIATMPGYTASLKVLAFNSDGTRLIGASPNELILWDTATWEEVRFLPGDYGRAAFSPDGQRFVCGLNAIAAFSADGQRSVVGPRGAVMIADTTTGQEVLTLPQLPSPLLGAAFSTDGRRLALVTRDGTVRIYFPQEDKSTSENRRAEWRKRQAQRAARP
jgi:WD40 repeat protein